MVLNDREIRTRIQAGLLTDHDVNRIKNCAYTLRAGKVFTPATGMEEVVDVPINWGVQHIWQIGPSEVLVVRTKEKVTMPADLCATYAPLYRLSKQGVMLLNASLVEPGYTGRLSCFLLNFSSQPVTIAPGDPIAKITFHTINAAPANPVAETIDDGTYDRGLADSAKRFHKSFMDVAGIADRAAERATKSARNAVIIGGFFIATLLAWAQLEPLFSTWFKKAAGWPTNFSERAADARTKMELEHQVKDLEFAKKSLQLEGDIQALKAELRDLKSKVK